MKLILVASLEIASGLDISGKFDGFFFFLFNIPTNYSFLQLFFRTLKMTRSQMTFKIP